MNRFVILLLASAFLFFGCGKNKKEPFAPAEEKSGKIVVNVTWPDSAYTSKSANLSSSDVDIITAYVYSVQREITHANLIHDGNQGIAEIIVPAGVNYRFDLVAYESWFDQVLYIGYEDSINVIADDTAYVNITMVDIAPELYSAEITGDNAFSLSWSSVPLATSYMLEESTSSDFSTDEDYKISKTVYLGPNTTVNFTDKPTGLYYYMVIALTPYDPDDLSNKELFMYDFCFHLVISYGSVSEVRSVDVGETGTISINIPWP